MKKYLLFILFCVSIYSEETITIPVIVSSTNPIYMKGVSSFQLFANFKTKIIYLSALKQDYPEPRVYLEKLEKEKIPLIIAFGEEAALLIHANRKKIPVLFSIVNSVKNLPVEKGGLCGFEHTTPLVEHFKIMKSIKPSSRKIYSFYSTSQAEQILKRSEDDIFHGLFLNKIKLESVDDFDNALSKNLQDADGFFLVPDPIYNEKNFETLSEYCKKNGIILSVTYPALVEMGATFGLAPDYGNVGRLTAVMAGKILSGEILCDFGPFYFPENHILYLNEKYSQVSGIEISSGVKNKVEKDRILLAGIDLFNRKMYNSAKSVFSSILEENPQNELATFYQRQSLLFTTSEETDILFKRADEWMIKKEFARAREIYAKIKNINPNSEDAIKKYDMASREESELKTKEAVKIDREGKPFFAIRMIKEALKIYPLNLNAKKELIHIREREIKKISLYSGVGINYYQNRKYKDSIIIFENILELEPNNALAIEYLRLSKIKKDTYEKLVDCKRTGDVNCSLLKE